MVALTARNQPRPAALTPTAIVIEPSPDIANGVRGLLNAIGFIVEDIAEAATPLAAATLVLVEADRGGRAIRMLRRIHAEHPGLPLIAVLPWWDDDEREVLDLVRLVLHVPVRKDQLNSLAVFAASLLAARTPS